MTPGFVTVNAICEKEGNENNEYRDGGEVINVCQCFSVCVCVCVCVCVRQPSASYVGLMTLVSLYS